MKDGHVNPVTAAADRTRLAWERSALGPLAAAALLLAKRLDAGLAVALLAAADVVLALLLIALGWRRSRRITDAQRRADRVVVPDATGAVRWAAVATAVLALATSVLLAEVFATGR